MTDVDPRVAKALKLFLVEDTTLTSFPKIEELKEAMRRYGEADEAFRACDKLGYGNAGRRNWSSPAHIPARPVKRSPGSWADC